MQDHRTEGTRFVHGSRGSFPSITIVKVIDVSTPEPAGEPNKKPPETALPLLLAVVGSVAGTLVSTAFNSSQELALLGAALGAAIPPMVAVAGPFTNLRLWSGILIAAIALVVTYGGFTARDTASGVQNTTFPVPDPIKRTTTPSPTPSTPSPTPSTPSPTPTTPSPSDGSGGFTCEEQLCIAWWPSQLHCSSDPCNPDVTVRSEGTEVLRVTGLRFTGDAAGRLWQDGNCAGVSLNQGETCSITVRVGPGAERSAQLRIQQNLQGPASLVDIQVDAW